MKKILLFTIIFIWITNLYQNSILKADNKNNIDIQNIIENKKLTIIYFLSIKDCSSCYIDKIKDINKYLLKNNDIQIIYLFINKLKDNEINFLKKKYKTKNIYSLKDTNYFNIFPIKATPNILITNNKFDILYFGFPNNSNLNNNILNVNEYKLLTEINQIANNDLLISIKKLFFDRTKNSIYILDDVTNTINIIDRYSGDILSKISTQKIIDYYFLNKDTSLNDLEKRFIEKGQIKSFFFDNNNDLNIFYKVNKVNIQINYDKKNNKKDTSVIIYPKILIVKYKNEKIFSIKEFNETNNYSFDFDNPVFQNNKLYLISHRKFKSVTELDNENYDNFVISSFDFNDSNYIKMNSACTIRNITNIIKRKYYTFFSPLFTGNGFNKLVLFSDLNALVLVVDDLKNKIISISPCGTLAFYLNYYLSLNLSPVFLLKNRNSIIFEFPYYINEIKINKDILYILLKEETDNVIKKIKIQKYNTINGTFINEIQVNMEMLYNILDIKYLYIKDNKIYFLVKDDENGWSIKFINQNKYQKSKQ